MSDVNRYKQIFFAVVTPADPPRNPFERYRPTRFSTWAVTTGCIALAMVAMGSLVWLVAPSLGRAWPVWPGAGVALVALLVYGLRCWPGVWLGTLAFNLLYLMWGSGGGGLLDPAVMMRSTIWPTLQALLGAWLTRSYFEKPEPLARARDVVRFLFLVGPVACLVSPTLGMTSMLATGRLKVEDLGTQWSVWWVGDSVGTLLIAPVALLFLKEDAKITWWRRVAMVASPLVVTGVFLTVAHGWLGRTEAETARHELMVQMQEAVNQGLRPLSSRLVPIQGYAGLMAQSTQVTKEEFSAFSSYAFRKGEMFFVDWAPRVTRGEREAFEVRVKGEERMPDYQIRERGTSGELGRAADRDEYFPVRYFEPEVGNERFLGFDHASDPIRLSAIVRARDSGRLAATRPIPLIRMQAMSILVFVPVYREGFDVDTATIAARREALRGMVVGVFDMARLTAPLAYESRRRELQFTVMDVTPGEPPLLLAGTGEVLGKGKPMWSESIDFGGRLLRAELRSASDYWKPGHSQAARLLLGFSLTGAFFVSLATLLAAGRNAAIAAEVVARTAALKRVNQELAVSDSRRREAQRFARLGHWTLHIESGVLEWSEELFYLVGRDPVSFRPDRATYHREVVHQDDLAAVQTAEDAACRGGRRVEFEHRVIRPDGAILWMHVTALAARDAGGRPLDLHGTVQDITARKEAEAEIRKLALAVANTNDGVVITDTEGRIEWVNEAFSRITGYSSDEARGRKPGALLQGPETDRATIAYMRERLRAADGFHVEILNYHKSGQKFWSQLEVQPLHNEQGQLTHFMGVRRDVTARREAEEEVRRLNANLERIVLERTQKLRAEERRYVALVENINDALIRDDREGRLVYANRRFLEWHGLEGKNMDEIVLEDYVAPKWQATLREWHERLMRGEEAPTHYEYEGVRADGGKFWLDAFVTPVVEDGRIVGTQSVLRDITARKEAEAEKERVQVQMSQMQKFEALGTLAGGIAHDFNNILTGILNYTELARTDCPADLPHMQEYLKEVEQCGLRARDLVRQILTFSRAEAPRSELISLQEVVSEALTMLRATLPASIRFEIEVDEGAPPIMGSASRLHQVIMNLMVNASHAIGDEPGKIGVRLQRRDIDVAQAAVTSDISPGPHVTLEISDTGCGMDEAVMARMFDPFFTTKPVGKGTGLGLAMVRGIVKDHEGAIAVASKVGEGTTFTLYFPVAVTGDAAPRVEGDVCPQGAGEHVLLVDDQEIVTRAMRMLLERLGYRVSTFTEAEAALERFRRSPGEFDVVLTDFQMPVMTGLMLTRRVREMRPEIPVVMMSGFTGSQTPFSLRQEGVGELLAKPVSREQIARALVRALRPGAAQ